MLYVLRFFAQNTQKGDQTIKTLLPVIQTDREQRQQQQWSGGKHKCRRGPPPPLSGRSEPWRQSERGWGGTHSKRRKGGGVTTTMATTTTTMTTELLSPSSYGGAFTPIWHGRKVFLTCSFWREYEGISWGYHFPLASAKHHGIEVHNSSERNSLTAKGF